MTALLNKHCCGHHKATEEEGDQRTLDKKYGQQVSVGPTASGD